MKKIYIYKFGRDFSSEGGALTLNPKEVGVDNVIGRHTKTHLDGWTIEGEVVEDYYYWINEFKACHPKFGKVWGNFEDKVYTEKRSGFKDFYEKHTPEAWDYDDI